MAECQVEAVIYGLGNDITNQGFVQGGGTIDQCESHHSLGGCGQGNYKLLGLHSLLLAVELKDYTILIFCIVTVFVYIKLLCINLMAYIL